MRRKMILLVMVVLSVGISACGAASNDGTQSVNVTSNENTTASKAASTTVNQSEASTGLNYIKITPEEAKKRLDSEKGILLLDVRTPEENLEKRIPNSLLIPVEEIEKIAPSKLTDKNAIIFVYCRSGRRSAIASAALVKMGYTGIFDLGGINDWPYETVSGK